MRVVAALPFSVVTMTIGLTSCASHDAGPAPQSICRDHFADVLGAQRDTVRGVTAVGPRPVAVTLARLGSYTGSTPITLCLIGKPTSAVNSAVAITPDGKTHIVWQQSGSILIKPG